VDARNGQLVWKVKTDTHPAAVITGAPALYKDTLYVPVSSIEEAVAAAPGSVCCTFRGSVMALDATTGAEKWRTWLVDIPQPQGEDGKYWGPSGVAVWNSPSIDPKRGQLYVATGDNYSNPPTELSDAILALDLETGKINWQHQVLEGDAWNVACVVRVSGNCPEDEGPDFDFGAGTVLATDKDGRELLLAGQKSGIAYAFNPDNGELLWQSRVGRGGPGGGILFGMATDGEQLFVPVIDMADIPGMDYPASPGLYALSLSNGEFTWRSPARNVCNGEPGCLPGIFGSITATAELVFAGSADGYLRIHDSQNGEILWKYDTKASVKTVSGAVGRGGSIGGGAAPLVYQNKLIAVSGYGFASYMPGNVLLVFEAD